MLRKRIITFSFIPTHADDEEAYYGGFIVYNAFCDILRSLGYHVYRPTNYCTFQRLPEEYVDMMRKRVTQALLCIPACRHVVVLNKRNYSKIAITPFHYTILVTSEQDAKRYAREHGYSV